MYKVIVRDSIMIAHSLKHPFFGPAQGMHGATYVVDVEFKSEDLNAHNVVIDIGFAHNVIKEVLSELNYQNLDELPQFEGVFTTTEYMARYIHDRVKEQVKHTFKGIINVTLGETHNAWAGYEGK